MNEVEHLPAGLGEGIRPEERRSSEPDREAFEWGTLFCSRRVYYSAWSRPGLGLLSSRARGQRLEFRPTVGEAQRTMEQALARTMEQAVSKASVQEKQLLLSRLLARLAHEIRNPLSSLDIHVQLLEEDVALSAPEIRERSAGRFQIIRGELERLDSLVQQFLSLAGRSSINVQPVEAAKVARHVCALLRPEAAARGIEIDLELAEPLPVINADPVQLTQALVNLVLNAIQAVERDGRVALAVEMDAAAAQLKFRVRDTGPGIPGENHAVIFEPFFTTKQDGSGLGLWIVQQIGVAHGGAVTVANAPGGGAVFTLQLPLSGPEVVHG